MKYPLHTTTHEQRIKSMEQVGVVKDILIDDFLVETTAFDEDKNELYTFNYQSMLDTLREFDEGVTEIEKTSYFTKWHNDKGHNYCRVRITNFKDLYLDIKENGLTEPVVVDNTGQKLDGSHRATIMKHLGHTTIKARVVELVDITEDFIKRTLEARNKIYGKNYYYIDYGGFTNIEDSPVYKENSYDRWEVLKDLIKGDVVDLGCNEGFISIQCSIQGHKTIGYEYEFADGANFNKQIFEFQYGKLPVEFIEADITDIEISKADTYLILNVIYHIPQDKQVELLKKITGTIIFQCNLRKQKERDNFRGCDIEGIEELCKLSGKKIIKIIEWRDKPIVIAQ